MNWWCCAAEFGEHEPTCKNYVAPAPQPPALDPARTEAIRAEIAWRLDGKMTQAEARYYGKGLTSAQS